MVVLKKAGPREPRCDADRIGFRMAAALHRFGVTRFCASQYWGTLGPLMADARPAADDASMVEVAWRPVEEYGTGYGEGFTKGWELGCAGSALSSLRDAIERGEVAAAQLDAAGVTVDMITAAQEAEDRAYVRWLRATGREVPAWRAVSGRDYPDDVASPKQSATCGADPCCGQCATSAGCIFTPKK